LDIFPYVVIDANNLVVFVNERFPVYREEKQDIRLREHPVNLEFSKPLWLPIQMEIDHQIRLEVIEIKVNKDLDRLIEVIRLVKWKFESHQVYVDVRFNPLFAYPAHLLAFRFQDSLVELDFTSHHLSHGVILVLRSLGWWVDATTDQIRFNACNLPLHVLSPEVLLKLVDNFHEAERI